MPIHQVKSFQNFVKNITPKASRTVPTAKSCNFPGGAIPSASLDVDGTDAVFVVNLRSKRLRQLDQIIDDLFGEFGIG